MKTFVFSILSLILILSHVEILKGQKYLEKGYIITNNSDTVYGFINFKQDYSLNIECEFYSENKTYIQIYKPTDIKGFSIINKKYFVSRIVEVDGINKNVFLEFLVEGVVNLYYLQESDKTYYFIEKESVMYPLTNEEKVIVVNNKNYLKSSNQYVGVLKYVFQDYPAILDKTDYTFFDQKSLINITKSYHNGICKDYKCIDYTKSTKIKYSIEPVIGYINSSLYITNFRGNCNDWSLEYGINLRFKPAIIHYSLNFLTGIYYTNNYFSGYYDYTFDNIFIKYQYELKNSIIKIPVIFEYSFTSAKFQPFVLAGFSNVFLLNPEVYRSEVINFTGSDVILNPVELKERKYQFGLKTGIGIRYMINSMSYILITSSYEYKKNPFDYYYTHSLGFHIGCGFNL